MWFDPYKLLASANFQDELSIDAGGGLGVDPVSSPVVGAPQVAPPMDALSQGAAPTGIPGSTNDPFSPAGMVAPGLSDPTLGGVGIGGDGSGGGGGGGGGGGSWANYDPGTFGGDGTPAGFAPTDAELYGGQTGTAPTSTTTPSTTTPSPDAGYKTEADKLAGASPGSSLTKGPGAAAGGGGGAGTGGGAGGANAFTQLANALRGVATAAQGGNPQAQQLMNMLRAMMQQAQMQGMMGGGSAYNPYNNQNPWEARRRMERMRREFMERQRLRQQLYPGTAGAARAPGVRHGR